MADERSALRAGLSDVPPWQWTTARRFPRFVLFPLSAPLTFLPRLRSRIVCAHNAYTEDVLYTVSELTNNLFAHHLPPLPASPKLLSTTSTFQLQPGEGPADRAVAGLLLSPALKEDACNDESGARSRPAPFLYATNRYDPSAEGDTVAIFSLDDLAMPTLVAEVHTGLQNLRGAAVGGEDSRWMVLGGMQGGGVEVYERVDGGRSLKEIAALPDIEGPAGFLWLTPRDHGF